MLRLALTLARLLVAKTLRHMAVTAALWVLSMLFFLIGLTGVLAALWIWLARVLDPMSAALIIGGGGAVISGLLVLIAQNREAPSLISSPVAEDLNAAFKGNKASAEVWVPLIALVLLGFVEGRRPKD